MLLGVETLTVEAALAAPGRRPLGEDVVADATRSTSIASWRASAPGTSSSRARGAASTGVRAALPQLAELGFDVVYLPPIHPIGRVEPQGAQQRARGRAGRSGQPVGDRLARRAATTRSHPELGTIGAVRAARRGARRSTGIEIALDFAIQCSPDHPWLKEHPEWFNRRPDGTLKYAENPPKKYQDIYNVNFDSEDWKGLWEALRDVVLVWVGARRHGLPRRQPAHEAGAVLGVADRRGARASTRR